MLNRSFYGVLFITLLPFLTVVGVCAQSAEPEPPHPPIQESAGEAEIAFQGYYQGNTGVSLNQATGMAVNFRQLLPGIGFLSGAATGYGGNGLELGENFIDLDRVRWKGKFLRFTGGDFQVRVDPLENPFSNDFVPALNIRGARFEISDKRRVIGVYGGTETLQGWTRFITHQGAPQSVLGMYIKQKLGSNVQLGARFVMTRSSEAQLALNPGLFPEDRDFLKAFSGAVETSVKLNKKLSLFGRMTLSHGDRGEGWTPVGGGAVSTIFGPTWTTDKVDFRVNYLYQTTSALPFVGYFAGDRKGPYAQLQVTPKKWINLGMSASKQEGNVGRNPWLPILRSSFESANASAAVSKSVTATLSYFRGTLDAGVITGGNGGMSSSTSQWLASLIYTRGRYATRFAFTNLNLKNNGIENTQRYYEAGEDVNFGHVGVGGALRYQRTSGLEDRNSFYVRGSMRADVSRVSAYAMLDAGRDLRSKLLFSTNTLSTSVVGANVRLLQGWNLTTEAFRTTQNVELNPESIFVQGGMGIAPNLLSTNQHWTFYMRFAKNFHWGATVQSDLKAYAMTKTVQTGTVEGIIKETALDGARPVEGVAVSLDDGRTSYTDASGHYEFRNVTEGKHKVAISQTELAAEFDPGVVNVADVVVAPDRRMRADLEVYRLNSLTGKIVSDSAYDLSNVVLKLSPSARYATPEKDGTFAFYNLREGDYQLEIDQGSIPTELQLASPAVMTVQVRNDGSVPAVELRLTPKPVLEKPVKVIYEETIGVGATRGGGGAGGSGGRGGMHQKGGRLRSQDQPQH